MDDAPQPDPPSLLDELEWRDATTADEELLEVATWVNVNWLRHRTSRAEVRENPRLAHYFADFGRRDGDLGVVAQTRTETVGVAWARTFSAQDPGYGYVADTVPEVSVTVFEDYRREGVGRALLERLADRLRTAGYAGASLSVEDGNEAVNLYGRLGYRTVGHDGTAETMLLDLRV